MDPNITIEDFVNELYGNQFALWVDDDGGLHVDSKDGTKLLDSQREFIKANKPAIIDQVNKDKDPEIDRIRDNVSQWPRRFQKAFGRFYDNRIDPVNKSVEPMDKNSAIKTAYKTIVSFIPWLDRVSEIDDVDEYDRRWYREQMDYWLKR